jgi:hypothetical protein
MNDLNSVLLEGKVIAISFGKDMEERTVSHFQVMTIYKESEIFVSVEAEGSLADRLESNKVGTGRELMVVGRLESSSEMIRGNVSHVVYLVAEHIEIKGPSHE